MPNKIYDRLVALEARAEELLKQYNPCQFREVKGKVVCSRGEPCCQGCQFLTKTGCDKKNKHFICSVWLCPTVRRRVDEELIDELEEIGKKMAKLMYTKSFLNSLGSGYWGFVIRLANRVPDSPRYFTEQKSVMKREAFVQITRHRQQSYSPDYPAK